MMPEYKPATVRPSHAASTHVGIKPAPPIVIDDGDYQLRFVTSPAERDDVMRLRFSVFNMELGEGLSESFLTGRDQDQFDDVCHHMVVVNRCTNAIVGTYRLQIAENALFGWYSNNEFQLDQLPAAVLGQGVELGRACIAKDHRSPQVLFLLWSGIAAYMLAMNKRYLFGCCSLASQDARVGAQVADTLQREGAMHPEIRTLPQPTCACYPPGFVLDAPIDARIPKLFRAYLRFGAKVCGPPAIDRDFHTIDYLVLFDREDTNASTQHFFGRH